MGLTDCSNRINERIENSPVGRYFQLKERNSNFFTELRGACATFLTMAYILAVNPAILADSGGPCVAPNGDIFDPEYENCLVDIKKQYITATAVASMCGCLLMGVMANLPIGLAPGMGINAYFAYSVVGWRGTGNISFQAASTAVLIEGFIFLFLAVTGARFFIIRLVPEPVRRATPAAIGAFLAHLGLQTAEGIGVVVADIATAVTLGGCPEDDRTPIVALTEECYEFGGDACVPAGAYTCDNTENSIMTSGTTWVGILGLLITGILLTYRINFAFIVGIAFVTIISWIPNTSITYFSNDEAGQARLEYFKKVVSVESMESLLFPYTDDLRSIGVALITLLYVDFLDTSGTLFGLVSSMGYIDEETGDFPRSRWAYSADAIATIVGSFFGVSPVTSYIESGAGVEAGSRTGLTAVFCSFFFFLSIFFAPIIASIPPWATGGALIIIGSLMARSLAKVKWYNPIHAITAFVTVMVMPLTYSIAYGLIAGIMIYVIMEGTTVLFDMVGLVKKPIFSPPGGDGENNNNNRAEEEEPTLLDHHEEEERTLEEGRSASCSKDGKIHPAVDEKDPPDKNVEEEK